MLCVVCQVVELLGYPLGLPPLVVPLSPLDAYTLLPYRVNPSLLRRLYSQTTIRIQTSKGNERRCVVTKATSGLLDQYRVMVTDDGGKVGSVHLRCRRGGGRGEVRRVRSQVDCSHTSDAI
jgi:hypothetical protein